MLNRLTRWHPGKGIALEADPRHAKVMVEEMQCGSKTSLKIPATKSAREESKK